MELQSRSRVFFSIFLHRLDQSIKSCAAARAMWCRLWGSLQWRFSAGLVRLVEVDSLVVLSCVHLCTVLPLALSTFFRPLRLCLLVHLGCFACLVSSGSAMSCVSTSLSCSSGNLSCGDLACCLLC